MIAKKRSHPWAQAVAVAGWVTLFFGFAAARPAGTGQLGVFC
jgi:hypothetical protein